MKLKNINNPPHITPLGMREAGSEHTLPPHQCIWSCGWVITQDKTCPFPLCGTQSLSLKLTTFLHDIPPCQRSLTSLTNLNSMIQHLKWAFWNAFGFLASYIALSWYNAHYSPGANTYHLLSVLYLQPLLPYWFHPLTYEQKTLPSPHVPPAFALWFASLQPFAGFWKGSLSAASTS